MASLAIKGHKTRGKEVIEILEILGGKNKYQVTAIRENYVYFVDRDTISFLKINQLLPEQFIVFTLEEFLKKYPYKVGDKVKCWINGYCSISTIEDMQWDKITNEIKYKILDYFYSTMNIQPYKEEIMEETNKTIFEGTAHCCDIMNDIIKDNIEETEEGVYAYNEINCYHQDFGDKVRIRLGGDFEIKVEDKLTYIVRKKPQYPKTYCECCDVLQVGFIYELKDLTKDEAELMDYFIGLKRCRDAYWKIAGQQMGLNKPWKPTYETLVDNTYFTIHTVNGKIDRSCTSHRNSILAFPTEEMRDTFYENFKDLIEECKEIL